MTALEMEADNTMGVVLVVINCLCFLVIVLASAYSMQEALNAHGRLMLLKVKVTERRGSLRARLSSRNLSSARQIQEKILSRSLIKDRHLLGLTPSQLEALPNGGVDAKTFHLFLSHVWTVRDACSNSGPQQGRFAKVLASLSAQTAQDQNRLLKKRLQNLVPNMRIFLDVDDLVEGKGADDIDKSSVCLVPFQELDP